MLYLGDNTGAKDWRLSADELDMFIVAEEYQVTANGSGQVENIDKHRLHTIRTATYKQEAQFLDTSEGGGSIRQSFRFPRITCVLNTATGPCCSQK